MDARDDRGKNGAGQFVDQVAKGCVFLWRSAHHGERPDRIGSVVYRLNFHNREIMRKAVISEMVSKRPFRQKSGRINNANDAKISFSRK